jgi:beta-mannosidase
MQETDLSTLTWQLYGWRPHTWRLGKSMETGAAMQADIGPVPARVPGSVQQTLLEAGILPDWNVGLNSLACEWVELRHWDFSAILPAGLITPGQRVFLDAQGLDYSGWILVDCREVAVFKGTLTPHLLELTPALCDGEAHQLSIVFDVPPPEQGQIGFTSHSRCFKPRFCYSWDWTPRLVPIGVWDTLSLKSAAQCAIDPIHTRALLAEDHRTGRVEVALQADALIVPPAEIGEVTVTLLNGDAALARSSGRFTRERLDIVLEGIAVEAWWPNGFGPAKTYTLRLESVIHGEMWRLERVVGFKRVRWLPCEGAPDDAEPWICEVNGRPLFLQGANWVPPRTSYPDSSDEEYRRLIELYRDMGCTCLRVWGGAILEKEIFYRLCDEAGILVWQEFPLSSSGVENWPPEDPETIVELSHICMSYIRRRAHHPALLLWCGGNELFGGGGKGVDNVPCDYTHPCLAAMKEVVERWDPGRRFLPTSASGPWEWGSADRFGTGTLHDVHGPWGFGLDLRDLEEWRAYWSRDDALLRSETGMPAAHSLEMIRKYGGANIWPPITDYWRHTAAWWGQWDRYRETLGGMPEDEALAEYIRLTQEEQAEAYAVAAAACKNRFPRCGGFLVWMGHDAFPCPANNAVIDFDRNPKPAYYALKKVFRAET